MGDWQEVAVTSDLSGQLWNFCLWDHNAGTSLVTYKNGISAHHALAMVSTNCFLSAQHNKPLIHVWALGKCEQVQQKLVMPGIITALSVSPDNVWLVAGIGEKLHVWQITSGQLMAVLSRHYQTITCVAFTDDGTHVVSAAEDGLVLVWSLFMVLNGGEKEGEPLHVWSDHSLPVTDLHVGLGGVRARVATCSLDQTCKLYELASGQLLLTVTFDVGLASVVMDAMEKWMIAGSTTGGIFLINLHAPPQSLDQHISSESCSQLVGHSKPVTCLAVSADGLLLLSGSEDETARVWHLPSHQCLRSLPHKGSVSNVLFCYVPSAVFTSSGGVGSAMKKVATLQRQQTMEGAGPEPEILVPCFSTEEKEGGIGEVKKLGADNAVDKSDLEKQIRDLQKINHRLYNFAVEKLLDK